MADQATKSIRRIVKGLRGDPTGLGAADDYKGLGTSRGEAFINARGDVTGSASTGSGDDIDEQPPSGTPGTGNPDDNDTGGGGGVNDGSDPGGSLGGDVADVDATTTTDSQIGTVTGTDPTTANFSSLNINTLEGIEYVPPDGFDAFRGTTVSTGSAFISALSAAGATVTTGDPEHLVVVTSQSGSYNFHTPPGAGDPRSRYDSYTRVSATGHKFWIFDEPYTDNTGGITINFAIISPGGTEVFYFDDLFNAADVPSDGECSLVYDTAAGGYKGASSDPDCSAAQQSPTDFVIIRSVSDPSKYFRYTKLANGGTKITQVDAGGVPVPGTITKTTDEGGRVDGFFDVALDAGIT